MARKKMRRFAGGGEIESMDEILVKGKRPSANVGFEDFNMRDYSGGIPAGGLGGMSGMGGGAGGGMPSQGIMQMPAPAMPARGGMSVAPAIVRQAPSALGRLAGDTGAKGLGARFKMSFAKGGKADGEPTGGKKRTKAKKYASGGKVSSASKRGDGCATKGKTKGRFV